MDDLSALMKATLRIVLFFSSFCLFLWAVVPEVRPYAAGLLLGTLVSTFNVFYLSRRIQLFTKRIIEKTRKRVSLGFVTRLCLSLITVMICVKSPQFELVSNIIGLFFAQMVILLMGFLSVLKKS